MALTVYRVLIEQHPSHIPFTRPLEPLGPKVIGHLQKCGKEGKAMTRCPIFNSWMKNTFVFRSPFDVDIKHAKDSNKVTVEFPKIRNKSIIPEKLGASKSGEIEDVVEFVNMSPAAYFCEEPLEMEMMPASLESNFLQIVPFRMDIGQWIRGVHIALLTVYNKDVQIRENQPLAYVRFNTDQQVKIVDVFPNDRLLKLMNGAAKARHVGGRRPMSKWYEMFKQSGMRKQVIKEIKNSLA